MGSNSGDADSTQPVLLKYSRASEISDEDFLAAARRAGGGFVYLWQIAWQLSDYEKPDTLSAAPDVSEEAVRNKAASLHTRGVIRYAKENYYLIPPPAEDSQP